MRRIIPGKIEVKTRLVGNFTITDFLVIFVAVVLAGLICFTSMNTYVRLILAAVIVTISVICVININAKKGYQLLYEGLSYTIRKKKLPQIDYSNNNQLEAKRFLKVGGCYSAVIEVNGLDFGILEEEHQDMLIRELKEVLEEVTEGSFIKLDRPVDYSNYITNLKRYKERIEREMPDGKGKNSRLDILDIHSDYITQFNESGQTSEYNYIVLKEKKEEILNGQVQRLMDCLRVMGTTATLLQDELLLLFLQDFFQTEEPKTPAVEEGFGSIKLNGRDQQIIAIGRYPFVTSNAWACELFSIEGVTAVFNFRKYGGKNLERNLHNAIREINGNILSDQRNQSRQRQAMGQAEILDELINDIVFKGEEIFDTQCYIMFDKKKAKEVMSVIRHCKVKTDLCFGIQLESYLNMLPYNSLNPKSKRYNLIQMSGDTVAAAFPFVCRKVEDKDGMYLGYNRNAIFFDPFQRDEERVNGNMVVLGQPGQGKSFFMKKTLSEYACKKIKVFVLDPEDEYRVMCDNLGGNYLDVGGSLKNKINPLQVFPSLTDDGEEGYSDDITMHRVFLEEFLRTICPNISPSDYMYLNRIIGQLYEKFDITPRTNLLELTSDKFPTFDDLYALIDETSKDKKLPDYEKPIFNSLKLYMEQFAGKGVYSHMWNGHTTIDLSNQFNVLNFRNLLANNNRVVANAQMLLIMRYLNLEIIRNQQYNQLHVGDTDYEKQYCLVLVDEAHNFIDANFLVALQTMKNMSKQIRKYFGVFWLATQNISDFVGQSEAIRAKASAIIDNCRLSMIFSLQPNDINNMIQLYKSSRPFTEAEKDILRSGKRGQALLKVTNDIRVPVQVEAFTEQRAFFE